MPADSASAPRVAPNEGTPGEPKPVPGSGDEAAKGDGPFHIPSLDGIRAVSFFIVFLSHAGLSGIVPGYFGLSLFFLLSGFLITTLLRMEFDRKNDVSLKQFYLRRVLRIFPPFYLVLGAAAILTYQGFLQGTVWPSALLAQVCHVTNYYIIRHGWWDGIAPGTWVYWSLAIEEHFYLVFPVVYLVLRRTGVSRRNQAIGLLAACAVVLAWRCILVFGLHAHKDRVYLGTDTRVDSILAGCVLAIFKNPVLDRDAIDDRRLGYLWLPLGCASVLVSLVVPLHAPELRAAPILRRGDPLARSLALPRAEPATRAPRGRPVLFPLLDAPLDDLGTRKAHLLANPRAEPRRARHPLGAGGPHLPVCRETVRQGEAQPGWLHG